VTKLSTRSSLDRRAARALSSTRSPFRSSAEHSRGAWS
jgi:hypothetical protein